MKPRPFLHVLAIAVASSASAQQPWSIGARGHYGFLWPHRPSSWILVDGHAPAVELFAERMVKGDRPWHHDYALPSFGIGVLYTGMANPDRIGAGVRVVPYLFLPFAAHDGSGFGIRIGWGVGYIAKPFDRTENTKQIAIGSRLNTAIQIMPEYRYDAGRWGLSVGLGIDHWSNGSFKLPNLGLNYLSASVGGRYALGPPASAPPQPTVFDQRDAPLREWSIVVSAFVSETARPLSGQHSVFIATGQRQWQVSSKSHLMAGMDLFNKGVLSTVHPEMKERERIEYTQLGVHGGYALGFGKGELFAPART
ncbi:MAG: acyloxyacyl hydrolase [Flavobacteriales bacterium]|nr:acyloxyacyl hydrolase [Flavobacteriales bacterium]